jgi:signal peptidase I
VSSSDPAIAMNDETKPTTDAASAAPAESQKQGTDWWAEVKAIFWLILAVLAIHSFIAKPFYIPSESMMPGLLKGDRLVVSKFPYGWSWVSPSFHVFPQTEGRLFGRMPVPGDVVILTPPGATSDYIKRVIAVAGDTVEMRRGQLIINGKAVKRERRPAARFPVDPNVPCTFGEIQDYRVEDAGGQYYCELPVIRETLANGRSFDTIDLHYDDRVDDVAKVTIPAGHVWVMGDNRDKSADSRVAIADQGLGGAVPWENIGGRAEFITFSLDGTTEYLNPISWFTAFRGGRAGTSLRPAEGNRP